MARMYSLSRTDGQPHEIQGQKYCNDQLLPDGAAYAHESVAGLLSDDILMDLVIEPDASSTLGEWCIVEYEADPASVIVPNKDEVLNGVFAIPLAEIKRTPVPAFIAHHIEHGNADERDAAELLQSFLDTM